MPEVFVDCNPVTVFFTASDPPAQRTFAYTVAYADVNIPLFIACALITFLMHVMLVLDINILYMHATF